MTRIKWNAVGERIFETGVDRGVLYIDGSDGVPWNGLVSVSESPTGGTVTPYYIDGIKYLNHSVSEEFEATLEAFTYPDAFSRCIGETPVGNGLTATQQPRRSFNLCYRTKVGNDEKGTEFGYKIHLVYGATAEPSERTRKTLGEEIEPGNFSWHILTKPPTFTGYKPTAHFVIDSNDTPADLLKDIEDILYGTVDDAPRIPSVPELLFLFEQHNVDGFDGGLLVDDEYFLTFDEGRVGDIYTDTLDGGAL